jgi:hypothetical protein
LKRYKSPDSDQIPAELIQAGGEILLSEIHKTTNSIWNKEDLPDNRRSLLLHEFRRKAIKLTVVIMTQYNFMQILTNIHLSRLSLYIDEIIVDYQCEFRHNKSIINHMFCICQILEKKWE